MTEYNGINVYIPTTNEIVYIKEGNGDNLFNDDVEQGYVDYIYYEIYDMDNDFEESDGGTMLLTEMFCDKYKNTAECIPDVLDYHYYNRNLPYVVLNEELADKLKSVSEDKSDNLEPDI